MRAVLAVVLLSILSSLFGGKAHRESERGNRAYEAGEHGDALRHYTEAQVPAPEAPELHYDIGNVLYRREEFEGAAEAYGKALDTAASSLVPDAAYNLGNALYRQQRFQDAVSAYRRAIEARPEDEDARRNLELALRAIQEQSQPQPQPQPEPREQDRSGDEPPRPDGQEERESDKGEEEDSQEPPSPREGMTPRDARQLLDRIAELEKEAMKRRTEQAARGESPKEKDW